MLTTLPQPDSDIVRFVRVAEAEDGMVDIFIAENHRYDVRVQHFVSRVQKACPGRIRWSSVSLDEVTQTGIALPDEGAAYSINQQKVLALFRQAIALSASDVHFTIGRDGGEFCYVEARVHGELQLLACIDRQEGMALASTIILSMCDVTEKQF